MPRPLKNHSPWRSLLLGLLALGLLALVVHTLFGEKGYLERRKQEEEIQRLGAEIERLRQENRQLSQEIQALKNDPQAVERAAREQLKMARPGEKVILLPEKAEPGEEEKNKP